MELNKSSSSSSTNRDEAATVGLLADFTLLLLQQGSTSIYRRQLTSQINQSNTNTLHYKPVHWRLGK